MVRITEVERRLAAGELDRLVRPFRDRQVPIETRVREGDPASEIAAEADALPADVLVMSTHGRSGFGRVLLGSVSESVLRQARVPVLTIGKDTPAATTDAGFRRILCAVDLTGASDHTVARAVSLGEACGASVTLLHVIENLPDDVSGEALYATVPEVAQLRHGLVKEAKKRLRHTVPEDVRQRCSIGERVATGTAWREILHVAGELEADLIVMGVHARGAISRGLFGSTPDQVVRQASCPVLVVRETAAGALAPQPRKEMKAAVPAGREDAHGHAGR
jgi:nucleotide-binding universal stress UspA family protein